MGGPHNLLIIEGRPLPITALPHFNTVSCKTTVCFSPSTSNCLENPALTFVNGIEYTGETNAFQPITKSYACEIKNNFSCV